MISELKQKKTDAINPKNSQGVAPVKRTTVFDGSDITIDPDLDRYSAEEFLPEKHKIAERRLANSALPWTPSFE